MSVAARELSAAPRLIVGASLLVWGWQTEFLVFAVLMAVVLETAHVVTWRWPITDKEFNIVSDLSSVIFLVVVVYVFSTKGAKGIFTILSILPFIFFLLLLTQQYSERGRVGLSALFMSVRRLERESSPETTSEIDLTLPYAFTCLLSASAGNQRTIWFFIATTLIVVCVLWSVRSRRYRSFTWVLLLTAAVALGYSGQIGLRMAQRAIEATLMQMFDGYMWRFRDPNRARTAIGSLARVKLSDRILLRVRTPGRIEGSLLLREASYSTYGYGVWSNQDTEVEVLDPDLSGRSWTLDPTPPDSRVVISTYFTRAISAIPVPHGTTRIVDVDAAQLDRNRLGTIILDMRKGWVQFSAEYLAGYDPDPPPRPDDLYVAENYRGDFDRLARELSLEGLTPAATVDRVERFFAENFTYSLAPQSRFPRGRYLRRFLFDSRSGHCEYFATSTTLLLRSAGIPARYVVGYAVDEYSQLEGQYVARARHAHSWTLAHVGGAWRVVDTTPSVWAPMEARDEAAYQPILDFFSFLGFKVARWQAADELEDDTELNTQLLWLLVPLVAILGWRLFFKERITRTRGAGRDRARQSPRGLDSEFYRLITELEQRGYRRRPGETLAAWAARIGEQIGDRVLEPALTLHYRYRFDPDGLPPGERAQLRDAVGRASKVIAAGKA